MRLPRSHAASRADELTLMNSPAVSCRKLSLWEDARFSSPAQRSVQAGAQETNSYQSVGASRWAAILRHTFTLETACKIGR